MCVTFIPCYDKNHITISTKYDIFLKICRSFIWHGSCIDVYTTERKERAGVNADVNIEGQIRDNGQRKGLDIAQDILEETKECRHGFSCLTSGRKCMCKPEDFCSDNVCFIKREEATNCSYMISFGYSFVCTCPTRKEIYRKYRM